MSIDNYPETKDWLLENETNQPDNLNQKQNTLNNLNTNYNQNYTGFAKYSFYIPHTRVLLDCGTEEITKQEFKAECDIYNILRDFSQTGIYNHVNPLAHQGAYIDLPDTMDYQESLQRVAEAQMAFDSLPSKVRDEYRNNPALFLAALNDPSQKERLTEWGVIADASQPSSWTGPKGPIVNPPTPAPTPPAGGSPSPAGDVK